MGFLRSTRERHRREVRSRDVFAFGPAFLKFGFAFESPLPISRWQMNLKGDWPHEIVIECQHAVDPFKDHPPLIINSDQVIVLEVALESPAEQHGVRIVDLSLIGANDGR